jgi:hypothetical protein
MLGQMKQQGAEKQQAAFDSVMMKSIQQSGAQVDPNNIPASLGGIVANAMLATITEAKNHGKQVPPQVVLKSATNVAREFIMSLGVPDQEVDNVLGQTFSVAMEQFLMIAQDAITEEERQKYVGFVQFLADKMSQGGQ